MGTSLPGLNDGLFQSLMDVLIASVQEAAEKVLRAHDVLTLSERDRKRFVATLVKPLRPGRRFGRR